MAGTKRCCWQVDHRSRPSALLVGSARARWWCFGGMQRRILYNCSYADSPAAILTTMNSRWNGKMVVPSARGG